MVRVTLEDPEVKNTMVEGWVYNVQGRLLLGPTGAIHAMELLHHSATGHLGVKKLLAKF